MLTWLPPAEGWAQSIQAFPVDPDQAWSRGMALAGHQLDFAQTNALDAKVRAVLKGAPPPGLTSKAIQLALLGSSTVKHLQSGIRVGSMRRGIHATIYEAAYGQYWQELNDPASGLYTFQPDVVLLALDAHHLAAEVTMLADASQREQFVEATIGRLQGCWQTAREQLGALCTQTFSEQTSTLRQGQNRRSLSR
jgi:hypothetical protein